MRLRLGNVFLLQSRVDRLHQRDLEADPADCHEAIDALLQKGNRNRVFLFIDLLLQIVNGLFQLIEALLSVALVFAFALRLEQPLIGPVFGACSGKCC